MKQINYKKLILPNIPYVFFVYLFDKVGQAVRLAPGADISAKLLNITQGFSASFEKMCRRDRPPHMTTTTVFFCTSETALTSASWFFGIESVRRSTPSDLSLIHIYRPSST